MSSLGVDWEKLKTQIETLADQVFFDTLRYIGISCPVPAGVNDTRTLRQIWRAYWRNPYCRETMATVSLATPAQVRGRRDGTAALSLHAGLQCIADIICQDIDDAFHAEYFPGISGMRVSGKHVARVMEAMQREIDGEARSRNRIPPQLADLPWERQVALTERRRYWLGQCGITPRTWKRGTWSVWKVKKIPLPDSGPC